jgi:N-acetylglutamate synthase and related acetyltransferases
MIIKQINPLSSDAEYIIDRLTKELEERYNEPGTGLFAPQDVLVERSVFIAGYIENKIVACGALRPVDDSTCEVKRMFVLPEYRGQGFSAQILKALEEKAEKFNYSKIILETGKRQPEALGLYGKYGYTVIPNYGAYANREMSVCFSKKLNAHI